ncbi:Hsp20/alpha crystallin family protein [Candidatus Geothermarchaeota archaeon]|nr:MAG: Hsp20/alpha crystallin family protein [Candidatus Geothermarchaeota archaeon]
MSWDPFEEIKRIKNEIDRMITDLLGRARVYKPREVISGGYRRPLIDVYETDKEVVVMAEMPGVRKEDIIVNVSTDAVEIRAELKKEEEVKKAGYYRREREYTGFMRMISLPTKVNPKEAKATYKNGILEIRLPKVEKKERVRIEIK